MQRERKEFENHKERDKRGQRIREERRHFAEASRHVSPRTAICCCVSQERSGKAPRRSRDCQGGLVKDVTAQQRANLVAEPHRLSANAGGLESSDVTEHVVANEEVRPRELFDDSGPLPPGDMTRRGATEVAVQNQRAHALSPPPAPRKHRTTCHRHCRIIEEPDHPSRPVVRQADAVVQEREDPAACSRGSAVKPIPTGHGVERDDLHTLRSFRPCLSRSHDDLTGGVADSLENIDERPRRPIVDGVDRDDQAQRRRAVRRTRIIVQ